MSPIQPEPTFARSLSSLTTLASNPPTYPRNPTQEILEPLVLYIVRVPGSRDIFLTTLKPREKTVTAEDVQSCLYYLHVSCTNDDAFLDAYNSERILEEQEEGAELEYVHRKPLPVKPALELGDRPPPPPKVYPHYQPPAPGEGGGTQVRRKAVRGEHLRFNSEEGGEVAPKPLLEPRPQHARIWSVDVGVGAANEKDNGDGGDGARNRRWTALPAAAGRGRMSRSEGVARPNAGFGGWSDLGAPELDRSNGFGPGDRILPRRAVAGGSSYIDPGNDFSGGSPPPLPSRPTPTRPEAPPPPLPSRPTPEADPEAPPPPLPSRPTPTTDPEAPLPTIPPRQTSYPTPEPDPQNFHITLIRRDPSSGSQWNIGTISNSTPNGEALSQQDPSSVLVELTTPGYRKFSKNNLPLIPPLKTPFANGSASSLRLPATRPSSIASFDQISHLSQNLPSDPAMTSTSFHRTISLTQPPSLTRPFHRRPNSNSTSSETYTYATPQTSTKRSSTRANYSFTSPWNGTCTFTTGLNGRSLKCRHTLPLHHGTDPSPSITVCEVRFNLPLSTTAGSPATNSSSTRARLSHHVKKLSQSQWKSRQDDDEEWDSDRMDLSLGREKAGGGWKGKSSKLGKLVVEDEGLKMVDLVVAGGMGVFWVYYNNIIDKGT